MKWLSIFGLLLTSSVSYAGMYEFLFGNDNYYECILYEMPDVENDQEAVEVQRQCKHDYPLSIPLVRKESYLDVDSTAQCTQEILQQTDYQEARGWIKQACNKVFVHKK